MSENSTLIRRVGRWIGRALTLLSGVYALAVLLYFGLRLTVGESFDPVALASSLMPALLLPALVLFVLMLLGRRWLAVGLLLPGVAFFLLSYGSRFIPSTLRASADSAATVELRVLTYNLQSKTANFEPLIAIIREADADVVALQELLSGASRAFDTALADLYPYRILRPTDSFARGMGILSKFPLSDDHYFEEIVLGSQRVRMTLNEDGQQIVFYNAHPVPPRALPDFDSSLRSTEIGILLDDAASYGDVPVLMAGDFNTTDQTDDYARVRAAGFGDAYATAGFGLGPTFPNARYGIPLPPIIRIDYVFYRGGCWRATAARVIGDTGGSDHYPVLVDLACAAATD